MKLEPISDASQVLELSEQEIFQKVGEQFVAQMQEQIRQSLK